MQEEENLIRSPQSLVVGQLEIGPKLDQFSMQLTTIYDLSDSKIDALLGLEALPSAIHTIKCFGASGQGMKVKYLGIYGYDPKRTRQAALSCCPHVPETSSSEILGFRNMREYGSGGIPEAIHIHVRHCEEFNSTKIIEVECRESAQNRDVMKGLETFQRLKHRISFSNLALCRAAGSIIICWQVSMICEVVSCRLKTDWLQKVAVHAASTMEQLLSGAMMVSTATLIMFQLSRELGFAATSMSIYDLPSKEVAAILSLLMDAGLGLVSSGLCLLSSKHQDNEYCRLMHGLAAHCVSTLGSANRSPKKSQWENLIYDHIRLSNFCPSRASVVVESFPSEMFTLITRCNYLSTTGELHKACRNLCRHAKSVENYQKAGHLKKGCPCKTTEFDPIETTDIVLFDTANRELVKLAHHKSKPTYIAVSQIWFQGVFGQSSRECGECSLNFLVTTCNSLGVRYAWIDTLCMPTSKELRDEVVGQLRQIYLGAAATLVVDVGLMKTAAKTVLDMSLAILLSDWSSRVWTLQEGVLASKLLFCVGNQVLSLPQIYAPSTALLLDPRCRVPSYLLRAYGLSETGLNQPLYSVMDSAAGRQTSWEQDNLYGLSALLPHPPERQMDLHLVGKEVAGMYSKVDLGILLAPYPRCKFENYRWMPLQAKNQRGGHLIGHDGVVTQSGLLCRITASVKLLSVVDDDHTRGKTRLGMRMGIEATIPVEHWYTTDKEGVVVGTNVKGSALEFCLVENTRHEHSFGFVVSPADNGSYQYLGCAGVVGSITETPRVIRVT